MEAVKKPVIKLSEQDGNVFNLVGRCTKALRRAGLKSQMKELSCKVWACKTYDEALQLMKNYVEVK